MSFPSLLVRLERARSISIHFQDERGGDHDWSHLDTATSELLQHEIDHPERDVFHDARTFSASLLIMRSLLIRRAIE